jgi:hypothetical protein
VVSSSADQTQSPAGDFVAGVSTQCWSEPTARLPGTLWVCSTARLQKPPRNVVRAAGVEAGVDARGEQALDAGEEAVNFAAFE